MCQQFNNCYNILSDIICSIICSWHSQTQDGKQHTRTLLWRKVSPSCHASCCRQCSMHGLTWCQSPASLVTADWTKNWCLTQRLWSSECPVANETGWMQGLCPARSLYPGWRLANQTQPLSHSVNLRPTVSAMERLGRDGQIPREESGSPDSRRELDTAEQWSRERTTQEAVAGQPRKQMQCRWVTILAEQ